VRCEGQAGADDQKDRGSPGQRHQAGRPPSFWPGGQHSTGPFHADQLGNRPGVDLTAPGQQHGNQPVLLGVSVEPEQLLGAFLARGPDHHVHQDVVGLQGGQVDRSG
jgi:hypothetical protein